MKFVKDCQSCLSLKVSDLKAKENSSRICWFYSCRNKYCSFTIKYSKSNVTNAVCIYATVKTIDEIKNHNHHQISAGEIDLRMWSKNYHVIQIVTHILDMHRWNIQPQKLIESYELLARNNDNVGVFKTLDAQKVANWISYRKGLKGLRRGATTVADVLSYCELNYKPSHEILGTSDIDQCFVLNFHVDQLAGTYQIIWTSRRLIDNVLNVQHYQDLVLYCDSTYKVNYESYPCQVVGFVDKDRHFIVVAYALCYTEQFVDWVFIFESLKSVGIQPSFILGDASESPMNAAVEVFDFDDHDHSWRLMCYAHVHNVSNSLHLVYFVHYLII